MKDPEKVRLLSFARTMRSDPTVTESMLWQELRGRRLGPKFKRQVPIGRFIADFVCHEARLVVEVDGESHDDAERDRARDLWFLSAGWTVLRLHDEDVLDRLDEVLDLILDAARDPSAIPDPLNLDP